MIGRLRSSRRAKSLSVLVAASALVLSLGLGSATAHKRTFETTLQMKVDAISDTALQLSGSVVSERARCEGSRTIRVTANGIEIATATSLVNGDWSAQVSPRPAKGTTLIAFTPRKFLKRNSKHKHKCASDFVEKKAP